MFTVGIVLLIVGAFVTVAEIQSLTIYLIAVALACFVAGGLALLAHTGLATTLIAFALILLAGFPVAHYARRRLRNPESDRVSRDDVGATVEVVAVRGQTLRVSYRGTEWDARPAAGISAAGLVAGTTLRIVERDGSILVVDRQGTTGDP
ncbi:MAG: NfeD family protein [Acidiferrobacterales bacterium]